MAMEMPLADLHALRGHLARIDSMAMARLLPGSSEARPEDSAWITASDAAERSRLPLARIHELCRSGAIPSVKLGRRTRRIEKASFDRWLDLAGNNQEVDNPKRVEPQANCGQNQALPPSPGADPASPRRQGRRLAGVARSARSGTTRPEGRQLGEAGEGARHLCQQAVGGLMRIEVANDLRRPYAGRAWHRQHATSW